MLWFPEVHDITFFHQIRSYIKNKTGKLHVQLGPVHTDMSTEFGVFNFIKILWSRAYNRPQILRFSSFQMWMNVRWVPPARRDATTHTALSSVAVIRATSSGPMALNVKVMRDKRSYSDSARLSRTLIDRQLIKPNLVNRQTSMSAATPVTCASTSVSTNQGSSPACAQRDTDCWAPECVRVSAPASISSWN